MTVSAHVETDLFEQKVEQFAGRVLDILNGGAASLMISIGHRTGLFDTLDGLPPSTSADIAREAGLNERYVREWLGAMVTAGIVRYDPAGATYQLPAEHAACLARSAFPGNLSVAVSMIPGLGAVEDGIVECFRHGGGLGYSAFPRFHEVMAEDSAQTIVSSLTEAILPLAPGLLERLEAGIDVLDVGCGSAQALCRMAREFPNSAFVGIDVSEEGLARGRRSAAEAGLTNVRLEVQDAARYERVEAFDLITAFDAIHDQAWPRAVLRNIRRALRPGGVFLMQDIAASSHLHENVDHPAGTYLYTVSCLHCMTVSLAAGGEGLGTAWGRQQALSLLGEAGFESVRTEQLAHDPLNVYYVTGKPTAAS